MAKRKYDEALSSAALLEEDWADSNKAPKTDAGVKKNSLDSDEEDEGEEKNYDILADDDIEGQEDGAAVQEGGVRITPFNMREELEEGHFDTEGNYHWKNEKEIRDNWLDNIEWVNIKNPKTGVEGEEPKEGEVEEEEDFSPESPFDQIGFYRKMLDFMKPKESVTKALQRLGGTGSLSASERLRRKKAGLDMGNPGDKQAVTDLTELANKILSRTGNMDIYQETYEYIQDQIQQVERKGKGKSVKVVEAELDMYADDFDEKAKEQKARREEAAAMPPPASVSSVKSTDKGEVYTKEPEVTWQFKWKKDAEEIHGPHTSEQMLSWSNEGYFKGEEWVRKVENDGKGDFYSIKRVDFDIYI